MKNAAENSGGTYKPSSYFSRGTGQAKPDVGVSKTPKIRSLAYCRKIRVFFMGNSSKISFPMIK